MTANCAGSFSVTFAGGGSFGGRLGQRAIGQAGIGRGIDDGAVFRAALRPVDAPPLRRGLDAASRARSRRRAAAAGTSCGCSGCRRRPGSAPYSRSMPGNSVRILLPVALQFLGQQHGERGDGALAHLRLVDEQRHRVVRRDVHPGVQLERRGGLRAHGQTEADEQAAGGGAPVRRNVRRLNFRVALIPRLPSPVGGAILRSQVHRAADRLVRPAAADVVAHGLVDIGVGRVAPSSRAARRPS